MKAATVERQQDGLDLATREVSLVAAERVGMFERLASDPSVPVEKLEKLIELQERIMAHDAKAEYYAAFATMQGEIPTVSEKGEIVVNGQLRSKYARNEDIQRIIRPILQAHGFALSFRNEFKDGFVKIIGILAHRSGHSEQDEFIAKADDSGSKNAIQALGSTRSYGQRYTTIALLNIATSGEDDDGAGSEKAGKPDVAVPKGFEDWWGDMQATAQNGIGQLTQAWNKSKAEYRAHLAGTNRAGWEALKAAAIKVRV